jgi:hypothetical protein
MHAAGLHAAREKAFRRIAMVTPEGGLRLPTALYMPLAVAEMAASSSCCHENIVNNGVQRSLY